MTATNALVVHGNGKQESVETFMRRTMFQGVPDDTLTLTLLMARQWDLDPLAKHVVVIRFKDRNGGYTYAPYVTRDGLLHVAHQSGHFDGISAVYHRDASGDYAEATVWRNDMSHPIVYRAYRAEYDTGFNVWKTHPIAMLTKAAEVIALRRAFDVSINAREEMDAAIDRDGGAVIDAEVEYIPDPELTDPPTPETAQDAPARPRGHMKTVDAKPARPAKSSKTEPRWNDDPDLVIANIKYFTSLGLSTNEALDALDDDEHGRTGGAVVEFKDYTGDRAQAKLAYAAFIDKKLDDETRGATETTPAEQPALIGDEPGAPNQYTEGA